MDQNYRFPASTGNALFNATPERVNQQRTDSPHIDRHTRESSVFEKVAKFDSLAKQSKQLERQVHDAALQRAVVGREQAEAEMRKYRDEARQLRKQMEEQKERERKVGVRLEEYMAGSSTASSSTWC
jgi:hypothetical protein